MNHDVPVEELAPLSALAEELNVPLATMRRWADVDRVQTNNFPEPVERIGNVKFYKRADVARWVALWRMTYKSNNFRGGNDEIQS